MAEAPRTTPKSLLYGLLLSVLIAGLGALFSVLLSTFLSEIWKLNAPFWASLLQINIGLGYLLSVQKDKKGRVLKFHWSLPAFGAIAMAALLPLAFYLYPQRYGATGLEGEGATWLMLAAVGNALVFLVLLAGFRVLRLYFRRRSQREDPDWDEVGELNPVQEVQVYGKGVLMGLVAGFAAFVVQLCLFLLLEPYLEAQVNFVLTLIAAGVFVGQLLWRMARMRKYMTRASQLRMWPGIIFCGALQYYMMGIFMLARATTGPVDLADPAVLNWSLTYGLILGAPFLADALWQRRKDRS